MSSPDINYPSTPSYGESLAEALKAQAEFLQGTGDFADTGSLESLLPLEESVRRKTAQTDTDVLRQTLLGTESKVEAVEDPETGEIKYGIPGATVVQDESGQELSAGNGRYQIIPEGDVYTILDTNTGGTMSAENTLDWLADKGYINNTNDRNTNNRDVPSAMEAFGYGTGDTRVDADPRNLAVMSSYLQDLNGTIEAADGDTEAPAIEYNFTNPNTGEALKEGEVVRTGDGLVDLLGDSRKVQGQVGDFKSYVQNNADLEKDFERVKEDGDTRTIEEYGRDHYNLYGRTEGRELPTKFGTTERSAGFDADGNFLGLSALAEDLQRGNLSRQREADLADVERLSQRYQDVMADFAPGTQEALTGARNILDAQQANLTGAGAITTPTGTTFADSLTGQTMDAATVGNTPSLTAQTSFDAATVGDRTPLTADTSYDPLNQITGPTLGAGTTYTASGVRAPSSLTADTSFDPSASVTGGTFDRGTTYQASQVADPLALSAATSFDPSANVAGQSFEAARAGDPMALTAATSYDPSASVTGRGYTATAGLDAGQIGADPLRQALMGQAMTAVDQGLTDREIAQIENAARARSTLSGRTFDQQSAIQEAQAVIAEDNARRMQNRGFAQGVLGQEADLQQSDLARGLQAQMQNQAALNQAAQFGASQDMQAQLANQAAVNQARQAGITAGLSQEALAAQQAQAVALADQAAQNRAREFGASSAMEAARANQAAINQARSQGLEAGLAQEALAASQAQTKAMADAQAANRAAEFGVTAGLDQQAQANQAALQAQLANQAAQNQAAQFGVTAGLQQEQLGAQLAQNKALADAQAVNRAREFGVQAGIGQEQAQAQLAQQAALANLGAEQQRQESGLQAGLAQEQLGAQLDQQRALADAQNLQQARAMGLTAGLEQDALRAQLGQAQNLAQAELDQQASAFGAQSAQQAALANQAQQQQANQFQVGAQMDAERLNEQLKQSGTLGYIDAATRLAALEDQATLDPFQALLGRGGGQSLQAGQGVLGQANYGLQSGPQYLNPEAGLGFISQMAANDANIAAAQAAASGSAMSGLFGGLGAIGGGLLQGAGAAKGFSNLFCWVAREVYGPTNPAWLQFREWMFNESPQWFFDLYRKYGERFASWISDKPRLKGIIRKWMDSKIGDK